MLIRPGMPEDAEGFEQRLDLHRRLPPSFVAAGEERMRELGHRHVVLWGLEDNPRARSFYEAAGWRTDGERRPIEFLGQTVSEVRYAKHL